MNACTILGLFSGQVVLCRVPFNKPLRAIKEKIWLDILITEEGCFKVTRTHIVHDLGFGDLPVDTADLTPVHLVLESSPTNCSTSRGSTPLAIAAVGTCERDLRWTTINHPDRFCEGLVVGKLTMMPLKVSPS